MPTRASRSAHPSLQHSVLTVSQLEFHGHVQPKLSGVVATEWEVAAVSCHRRRDVKSRKRSETFFVPSPTSTFNPNPKRVNSASRLSLRGQLHRVSEASYHTAQAWLGEQRRQRQEKGPFSDDTDHPPSCQCYRQPSVFDHSSNRFGPAIHSFVIVRTRLLPAAMEQVWCSSP